MMCTPGHREECWGAKTPASECECNCQGRNHGIARERDEQGDVFDMPELRLDKMEAFPSIEAFYAAHEPARRSPESDMGVWWRDDDGGIWRVTYVHHTGHVYAIGSSRGLQTGSIRIAGKEVALGFNVVQDGPVVVLGKIDAWTDKQDDEARRFSRYGTANDAIPIERVLKGWANVCGEQGSLAWVAHRIQGASR